MSDASATRFDSLGALVGATLPISPERSYLVQTKEILLGRGLLDQAGAMARRHLGGHSGGLPGGSLLLLVSDTHLFPLFGQTVRRSLEDAGFSVVVTLLPDASGGKVEADDESCAHVLEAIQGLDTRPAGLIALGAGTVNDCTKLPAFREGLPYGVITTAASMNGYTSAIAAILQGGVKRTLSAAPPRFVLTDLDVVASAPIDMARAGLGDLLSKPVSSADWRLSHRLLGEPFMALPVMMVEDAFRRTQALAEGIGQGRPEALGPLMEALLISGISMASAGSSSPASGGEHLLSHLWDMTSHYRGRPVGAHGAQVGVATLVTATLYQKIRAWKPGPDALEHALAHWQPWESYRSRLQGLPDALRPLVEIESRAKLPTRDALRARLETVLGGWEALGADLDAWRKEPKGLRKVLEAAGAPTTARALGIPEIELREAYRIARDIRARYTVLDLAYELVLLDALEDTILEESGVL